MAKQNNYKSVIGICRQRNKSQQIERREKRRERERERKTDQPSMKEKEIELAVRQMRKIFKWLGLYRCFDSEHETHPITKIAFLTAECSFFSLPNSYSIIKQHSVHSQCNIATAAIVVAAAMADDIL